MDSSIPFTTFFKPPFTVALLAACALSAAVAEAAPFRGSEPVPRLGRISDPLFPLPSLARDGREDPFLPQDVENRTYQIGEEWGKKPLTQKDLETASPALKRAALATARTGGATGFFLGEFAGKLVMATNHHVYPSASRCEGSSIRFPLLEVEATCSHFIGTWDAVDLSLFVIDRVSAEDRQRLLEVASNFDFSSSLRQGQELVTVGFGVGNNPRRRLVANEDSDCKVYSQTDEFRFMGDPDELNPGTYETWSFANGCDVSHGDSGSAMVDRSSGKPIGLIWTGRIPKIPEVQDASFLASLFESQGEEIWTELSYGVPAQKIKSVLEQASQDAGLDEDDRLVLESILGKK